jgi:hypothetical protein
MPLIQSKSQAASAAILSRVKDLAGHYNAAAGHLNAIVRDLLALGDADLAAFCNQLGPQGLFDLTSLHGAHGSSINQLSQEAADLLDDSGVVWPMILVDVRPLHDKLADQGRELVVVDGVFSVQPLPSPTE